MVKAGVVFQSLPSTQDVLRASHTRRAYPPQDRNDFSVFEDFRNTVEADFDATFDRISNRMRSVEDAMLRLEREGRALTGAEARAYLLGFGDEQLRMTAAALLGQRSLSAGGGGEKLAPGVVESVTNALILFVMESVISLQA